MNTLAIRPRFALAATASLAAFVAFIAFAGTASAQGIGINFTGASTAGGIALTPADQPGIVAGANWNNYGGASGTYTGLLDNSGSATSVALSFSSAFALASYNTPSTPNSARNRMYSAGIADDSSTQISIQLNNIPYANYDVYVYSSQDSTATNTMRDTDGTTTFFYRSGGATNAGVTSLTQTTSTSPGSPTVAPAAYQFFGGKTSSTLTIIANGGVTGTISNNVFGLQIVKTSGTAAPEPGSVALLAVSALPLAGLVARRRHNVVLVD